ncbi:MAG: hypothetical protein FJX75_19695 [Armatimonadetes bacterium]|nr:hypothetical protein [Armatimonadota bacterium]
MTWLDLLTVVLFVLVAFIEAKRGAVPAAVDLLVGGVGLALAKRLAPTVSPGSEGTAFLLLFIGLVVVTGLASWLVDTYTKWEIGPYDSTVAGVLGAVTGLILAHGAFHAAVVAGGGLAATARSSMLAVEVYDLRTLHAIGDMFRNLGGGKSITESVREREQK